MIPEDLKYSKEHEWVRIEGDSAVMGITHHAQQEMGDLVFVELPREGDTLTTGQVLGTVESVKAVSELFAPLAGEVLGINEALVDRPELINQDPYGEGWMLRIKIAETPDNLMSAADYGAFVSSGAE
jgi:glycine cleavage system H protein